MLVLGTYLVFSGLVFLAALGTYYAFAPAPMVLRARGIEPTPAPIPAAPRAYRDAKGRWRDSHTNRFCKAPAFA